MELVWLALQKAMEDSMGKQGGNDCRGKMPNWAIVGQVVPTATSTVNYSTTYTTVHRYTEDLYLFKF